MAQKLAAGQEIRCPNAVGRRDKAMFPLFRRAVERWADNPADGPKHLRQLQRIGNTGPRPISPYVPRPIHGAMAR